MALSPAIRPAMILAAVLAALAGGCRPRERESTPLRIATHAAPLSLDPHRYSEWLTYTVLTHVYEGLVRLDRSLHVEPALAERWENPDDTTWRFKLRPGARFHDGRPVRAADVVFSLRRARSLPDGSFASYLASVDTFQALDETTVELKTHGSSGVLLNKLASILIVPDGSPGEIRTAVGTGPYRVVRSDEQGVTLQAFEGYWGGAPSERDVQFVVASDRDARLRGLREGTIDLVWDLAASDAVEIRSLPCCRVVNHPSLAVDVLQMRVDARPFSDVRVRRALHLALDREALVRDLAHGWGAPANQLVGRQALGHDPSLPPATRDLARARALLAEAGYRDGVDATLEYRIGRNGEPLQRQLAEAGFRISLRPGPWAELLPRMERGDVQLYYGGLVADAGDSSDVLMSELHSPDPEAGLGEINHSGYASPELDRLLAEADRQREIRVRGDSLQRAMRVVMRDLPIVPLIVPDDLYAVRRDIEWTPRVDGRIFAGDVRRSR